MYEPDTIVNIIVTKRPNRIYVIVNDKFHIGKWSKTTGKITPTTPDSDPKILQATKNYWDKYRLYFQANDHTSAYVKYAFWADDTALVTPPQEATPWQMLCDPAYEPNTLIHIIVTRSPKKVYVVENNQIHSGKWSSTTDKVKPLTPGSDPRLLLAAMYSWAGFSIASYHPCNTARSSTGSRVSIQGHFSTTARALDEHSNGWGIALTDTPSHTPA